MFFSLIFLALNSKSIIKYEGGTNKLTMKKHNKYNESKMKNLKLKY